MNRFFELTDDETPALVDRLVCGELDEVSRRRLLDWFEGDPARWRQCGLAFLEAQSWSQVLGQWPHESAQATPAPARTVPNESAEASREPKAARRTRLVRQSLLAACLFAAFGLGFAMQRAIALRGPGDVNPTGTSATGMHEAPQQEQAIARSQRAEPVLVSVDTRTGGERDTATPIRIPVVPADLNTPGGSQPDAGMPDYVRRQWERRGYKVSLERRYLFAKLPDGQQVVVPVEQYHFDPIPLHIN